MRPHLGCHAPGQCRCTTACQWALIAEAERLHALLKEGGPWAAHAEGGGEHLIVVGRLETHRPGQSGPVLTRESTVIEVAAALLVDLERRGCPDGGVMFPEARERDAVERERQRVLAERTAREAELAQDRDAQVQAGGFGVLADGGGGSRRHGRAYL